MEFKISSKNNHNTNKTASIHNSNEFAPRQNKEYSLVGIVKKRKS